MYFLRTWEGIPCDIFIGWGGVLSSWTGALGTVPPSWLEAEMVPLSWLGERKLLSHCQRGAGSPVIARGERVPLALPAGSGFLRQD